MSYYSISPNSFGNRFRRYLKLIHRDVVAVEARIPVQEYDRIVFRDSRGRLQFGRVLSRIDLPADRSAVGTIVAHDLNSGRQAYQRSTLRQVAARIRQEPASA